MRHLRTFWNSLGGQCGVPGHSGAAWGSQQLWRWAVGVHAGDLGCQGLAVGSAHMPSCTGGTHTCWVLVWPRRLGQICCILAKLPRCWQEGDPQPPKTPTSVPQLSACPAELVMKGGGGGRASRAFPRELSYASVMAFPRGCLAARRKVSLSGLGRRPRAGQEPALGAMSLAQPSFGRGE